MQWRRSYDVQPPALDIEDNRNPRKDPRYAAVSDAELPATEALCDTIARLMPYYEGTILPAFNPHFEVNHVITSPASFDFCEAGNSFVQ